MADAAVVGEGVRRHFGETEAVAGVDLEVHPGEIYGFLGPNGAGKSTLVRVLCTLITPTAGRALVAGFDVATEADEVRLRIGVALQDAALDGKQSGREFLLLQARLYGMTWAEARARLEELLTLIDIGDAIDRPIGTYSGGMARRLDLAAALVHRPQILFLDQPTTGLAPASRAKVWDEVRTLNEDMGMSIFLTTQYLEEADELAHRVGIIDRGRLVAEGTPQALKQSVGTDVIVARVDGDAEVARSAVASVPGIDAVEIHRDELTATAADGAAVISPVAVALNGCGVTVRDLTLRTPTLDDVFLELTGEHIERNLTHEPEEASR